MARKPRNSQNPKPEDPPEAKARVPVAGTVVFFHPDLGIGGAERLVVDAAVGLQNKGNKVVIFTNHCDSSHCFDECRDGELPHRSRSFTASGRIQLTKSCQELSTFEFAPIESSLPPYYLD